MTDVNQPRASRGARGFARPAGLFGTVALLHGSELSAGPPFPERASPHSVAVGHPEKGHRVENHARELHLHPLARQGATPHGIVKLSCYLPDFGDEQQCESLPQTQVSSPDHQSRGLAVSPILSELSRHRGPPCGTRSYRLPRDCSAVVSEVRTRLRSRPATSAGSKGRHLAFGRAVREHPGQAALSLASRRPRW